jgi:hypothetical protein
MATQIRAQEFPDLGDEVMYPRLSAAKLEQLAKEGTRPSFAVGDGGLAVRFAHQVLDA